MWLGLTTVMSGGSLNSNLYCVCVNYFEEALPNQLKWDAQHISFTVNKHLMEFSWSQAQPCSHTVLIWLLCNNTASHIWSHLAPAGKKWWWSQSLGFSSAPIKNHWRMPSLTTSILYKAYSSANAALMVKSTFAVFNKWFLSLPLLLSTFRHTISGY